MCPCSTANVREVQCLLSGWMEGCLGELLGTWKTQQMVSVGDLRVGDAGPLMKGMPCRDGELESIQVLSTFSW